MPDAAQTTFLFGVRIKCSASARIGHIILRRFAKQQFCSPIRKSFAGRVGEAFEEEQNGKINVKVFLYTHKKFTITYNNNRVSIFFSLPMYFVV
jgi:hypothetical protein